MIIPSYLVEVDVAGVSALHGIRSLAPVSLRHTHACTHAHERTTTPEPFICAAHKPGAHAPFIHARQTRALRKLAMGMANAMPENATVMTTILAVIAKWPQVNIAVCIDFVVII